MTHSYKIFIIPDDVYIVWNTPTQTPTRTHAPHTHTHTGGHEYSIGAVDNLS